MLQIYQDGYVIAAGQDVYNNFHTQDDFHIDCDQNWKTQEELQEYPQCGSSCGVCFEVEGVNGKQTYIVQEIADINAVEDTGRGLILNIGWGEREGSVQDPNQEVMNGNGVQNITYRKVDCPLNGKSVYLAFIEYNNDKDWDNVIEIFPANFLFQITTLEVRGGVGADDATSETEKGLWHGMPRT